VTKQSERPRLRAELEDAVNQYLAAGNQMHRNNRQRWFFCTDCCQRRLSALSVVKCRGCGAQMTFAPR
jgi:hypothetical protein